MLDPAPTAETEAVDPREARAARRLSELERLSRIGIEMAEALGRRVADAVAAGEAVDGGAAALEFSRLSMAVRRTLALEARFDAEGAALAERLAAERAEKRAQKRDEADRERLVRIGFNTDCVQAAVTQVIDAEVADDADNERGDRLDERLMAHLEDPREEDDIADLPVSALIARICEDLGLSVDWSLWEDEEWAVAEWRDAVGGSPYAPGGAESVVADAPVEGDVGLDGGQGAVLRPSAHDPPERHSA